MSKHTIQTETTLLNTALHLLREFVANTDGDNERLTHGQLAFTARVIHDRSKSAIEVIERHRSPTAQEGNTIL